MEIKADNVGRALSTVLDTQYPRKHLAKGYYQEVCSYSLKIGERNWSVDLLSVLGLSWFSSQPPAILIYFQVYLLRINLK